jgi:hypothetical protein
MVEVCRIYNREIDDITISVEPWGASYVVPTGHNLQIHCDEKAGLIEISDENGILSVFINDGVFDDFATKVVESL